MERWVQFWREEMRNGKPLIKDPQAREMLADMAMESEVEWLIGWHGAWRGTEKEKLGLAPYDLTGILRKDPVIGSIHRQAKAQMKLFGMYGQVQAYGTSDVWRAYGIGAQVRELGSATIDRGYGIRVMEPAGDIPIYYGIYIDENLASGVGSTALYSIFSEGGIAHFRVMDPSHVGLRIKGAAGQTAQLFKVYDNGNNDLFVVAGDGNVGVRDSDPDYPLEIRTSTNPQVAISHTDGVDFMTIGVDGDGEAFLNPTGAKVHVDGAINISLIGQGIYLPDVGLVIPAIPCDTEHAGMLIWNATSAKHRGCNSTDWNDLY